MEKTRSEKKGQLIAPKCMRKNKNAHLPAYLRGPKYHGNRKPYNQGYAIGLGSSKSMTSNELQAITKRRKFKGYQREARRWNKKAA